jgi:hypothetical protein
MKYPLNKGLLVRYIKDLPCVWFFYKVYTERLLRHRLNPKEQIAEKVFSSIYRNNDWNNRESLSGQGSTLEHTRVLVNKLPSYFEKYNVNSVLDAPCGDFNWMRHVDMKNIYYIGGDVVQELIDKNNEKYGNKQFSFIKLDIILDPLPKVDLILVRDCLVHFNNEAIVLFLKNLIASEIKYIMTTNFPITKHNYNITMGNFRFLNLLRKPYNFPKEKDILWEESKEVYGQCPDKSLFLWDVNDIRKIYNG